jgi:hypothetical protein
MNEMIDHNLKNDSTTRDRRGEKLRLSWGADARATPAEIRRPALRGRRVDRRSARFGPERAAAERAFAHGKHRAPGAPPELPHNPERAARFRAIEQALRQEWQRVRDAEAPTAPTGDLGRS